MPLIERLRWPTLPTAAGDAVFADITRVYDVVAPLGWRAFDPARLAEPRTVGRRRLPTTAIGLLTHTAEHTQRHVGQAIAHERVDEYECGECNRRQQQWFRDVRHAAGVPGVFRESCRNREGRPKAAL